MDDNNDNDNNNGQYLHTNNESLHGNNSTMIIKDTDINQIQLDTVKDDEKIDDQSITNNNSILDDESITRQTINSLPISPKTNPLHTTKLTHQGDDVEIGVTDEEHSPAVTPYGHHRRMPSISYNNVGDIDKELKALRRSSRRKWWSPTRLCDWCMHKLFLGKIMIMILTWTTVIDYIKDLYVAYHLYMLSAWIEFSITLCILFLSLRLMLYLRATDDSGVSFTKLLIFYLPGSVYADFQIDRFSDVGVCVFWEIAILLGTPFVPFFLIYLSFRKSYSLFFGNNNFENQHLLSYAVVEALFETIPQLILQSYLYFIHNNEIEFIVFLIAWIVCVIVLIKIPIMVWYNWRIVYKLSFKRRHCGEIMCIKFHPIQDIIASGSWDHTVLINSIIDKSYKNKNIYIKAKRVLDHHYNINSIAFSPKFINSSINEINDSSTDIIAVAGQGIELFNWRYGKSLISFPKTKERDQLRRKKRLRTKEVKEVVFSPNGKRLIWCQGKNILIWDILNKCELGRIKCVKGNRLGDVMCIDISPNGKYIAAGLYQPPQIRVYNSYNRDLIRILEGHTSSIQSLKFDRYGKYIISGSSDCSLRVFDLRYGKQIKQFNKHDSDILSVSIDYTNRYIASGGRDKILYITYLDDNTTGTSNTPAPANTTGPGTKTKTGTKTGTNDDDNISDLRELEGWKPHKTVRDILSTDFSPYGDTVGLSTEDGTVRILSLPDECHAQRTHRFSTDFATNNINNKIVHQIHSPQKDINGIDNVDNINNDTHKPLPPPSDPDPVNGTLPRYSDVEMPNSYHDFDPKSHVRM